jgi:putative hydrolase of HD superfamily
MRKKISDFLFEAATLKRLQRTGWQILGGNKESIAEHSYMVAVISFTLAESLKIDVERTLLMALFHDFIETRTGDIYKLSDLYVRVDEKRAAEDAFFGLTFQNNLIKIIEEYEEEKTLEAKIVHDADTLALCVELKQLIENGNLHAREWYNANLEKVKLPQSKKLAKEIDKTNSQDWWKKERDKIHKSFLK